MRTQLILAALAAATLVPLGVSAQAAYQTGYYDDMGNWIPTAPSAAEAGANSAYTGAMGTRAREVWIRHRIDNEQANGDLTAGEARSARNELNSILDRDDRYRAVTGDLTIGENAQIQLRLDALEGRLRAMAE